MSRDELLKAIQDYAEEWKSGHATIWYPAKTALYIALDKYEWGVIEKTRKDILREES